MAISWTNLNGRSFYRFVRNPVSFAMEFEMNGTIVTNPNYFLNAQQLPLDLALSSLLNGVDILERLHSGQVVTPYDRLWNGHKGSLASYCTVLCYALQGKVDYEDFMPAKRRLNALKIETNDDAPQWTMDERVNAQHQRYIETHDEALLTEF